MGLYIFYTLNCSLTQFLYSWNWIHQSSIYHYLYVLKFTWIHLNKYCPLSFQHSVKYQEYFLKSMLGYVCDTQPEIRQAAAYGVGVMAQFGTELYAATCAGNYPLCQFDSSSSENGLSRHAFLKKSNWLRSLL